MYTSLRTHVEWIGIHSRWLCARNGVEQGGVLSPVLFYLYIDGQLYALESSRFGCCIGHYYTGAAYANDIVLLAPTVRSMRSMLI